MLAMPCTRWVLEGQSQLVRLADDDGRVVGRALADLNLALDAIAASFYTAPESRGGWVQDLTAARDGVARLAELLGPA